uniref:TonB-dependent receptor n=1 Tax=Solibacter usitatus (strain Ellin6076) TaxID=234267 RepID=Q020G9_SOLUE
MRTHAGTVCFLVALFATLAPAQNFGRISGTLTDSSGAVMPGVKVRVINEGTAVERVAPTNETGSYVATNLPVGTYTVKADPVGFQAEARTGLTLVADGRLTVDITLRPGNATQSVDVVAASGEALNTVSGEIARQINTQQVENLALNGRNYLQLATLIPGSALLDEDQMATTTSLSTSTQAVNGNRGISNNLMVDGSYNLDSGSNSSQLNNVGVDFIREVAIKTSNFSAEYGRNSGAAINVITRSGGNQFHGGALEFLRNDTLDARNYFSPSKGKLRFNDFGWNLGGPIKRNKLFFFAGQEWKRIRQDEAPLQATLPTRAQRLGDFSAITGNLFFPGTTTPIPNRSLSGMITPDGKALANVFNRMESLAASYTDIAKGNNTVYQFPNPFNWREEILRIDYIINEKHSLYGRYLHDDYNLIDPHPLGGLPTVPINRVRPTPSYQLTETWSILPNLINEARGSATWSAQRRQLSSDTWKRETYGFQYPQIFGTGPLSNGIPAVSIDGITSFPAPTFVKLSPNTEISFNDNLSWVKGSHTLKVGVLVARNRKNQNGSAINTGSIAFSTSGNTLTTGNAFADALLGNYRTYSEANNDPVGYFRYTQADSYVQDNWRINKHLSLELGLRFQSGTPTYSTVNNMTNFVPSLYNPAQAVTVNLAGVIVAGSGNPFNGLLRAGSGVPSDETGRVPSAGSADVAAVPAGAPKGLYSGQTVVAPRFGFAWAPFDDSKTSIRGGFGMFYDRPDGNITFPTLNSPPFIKTVQFQNGNLSNPSGGAAAALAPFATITAIDPNLHLPYTENFSLSVQRELPRGFLVETAYVGNLGRHLLRAPDINQPTFDALVANAALPAAQRASTNTLRPYKGYSSIIDRLSDSTSNYHALQVYTTKRTGDLTLTASYTFSKVLTDASGEGDNPEDPANRHYSYGPASFDRRHILVGTYSYQIPFARHWKNPAKYALAGWQFSGINRFQTGPYYSVSGNTSIGGRRADYVGGPILLPQGQRTVTTYLNPAAFAAAPNGRRGNTGVGIVQGPGLMLWDISLRKEFAATERFRIRLQGDVFNLMNRANFRGLNTNATDLAFGSITAAGPARNVQLGLKLQF